MIVLVSVLVWGSTLGLELHLVRVLEQRLVRIEQAIRPEQSKAGKWAEHVWLEQLWQWLGARLDNRTSRIRQERPE